MIFVQRKKMMSVLTAGARMSVEGREKRGYRFGRAYWAMGHFCC
jgi:hypothetical protein